MKNLKYEFLEFAEQNIYYTEINGINWISVKPICRALGVDYITQCRNLKKDLILSQHLKLIKMPDSRERFQNMTCISEIFLYGWLFNIRSKAPQFNEYKLECYNVLFDHFTRKKKNHFLNDDLTETLLSQFSSFEELEKELESKSSYREKLLDEKILIESDLSMDDQYLRLQNLKGIIKNLSQRINTLSELKKAYEPNYSMN